MSENPSTADHIADLVARCEKATPKERVKLLHEMIDLYEQADNNREMAQRIRRAFLKSIDDAPETVAEQRFAVFLADQIESSDFEDMQWESPSQVVALSEMLYSFQVDNKQAADRIQIHLQNLLRQALHHFEKQGDPEKMFELLRQTPTSANMDDIELRRLRNRAYLYEMRRVQRLRRYLYIYLAVQALLVFIVFPLLFINAENGAIQAGIERAANLNLPEQHRRQFSYYDGVYWALITAGSIGYGDITPITDLGRALAAILGVMGVITVGVIAGLILDWITPRRLE